MTIEEIKEKYGDSEGYVTCDNCPSNCCPRSCTGYDDAYEAIQKYLDKTEPTNDTTNDTVFHPAHYTNGGMECIDEMILIFGKEAVKHFCLCNAWKYRRRALYKNGEEDMQKSHWYLEKYKELGGATDE